MRLIKRSKLMLGVMLMSAAARNAGGVTKPADGSDVPEVGATTGQASGALGTTTEGGGQNQAGNVTTPPVSTAAGAPCGYNDKGQFLHVADGIDVCVPPAVCTSETCPPPLGDCVNGTCVYKTGYDGLKTLPQAWATYYCQLSTGGCNGVTQSEPPLTTATKVGALLSLPLCEGNGNKGECVGIAASSAMLVGNSQVAIDPSTKTYVKPWGLGLSEASNLCYRLTGPGGSAVIALTDRCGSYCKCNGSGFQECGPCVSAPDMVTNCPCVGTAPPLYSQCCGNTCGGTVVGACDWCANNNHPHFDLDTDTFNYICGTSAGQGSCAITQVAPIACSLNSAWPPP